MLAVRAQRPSNAPILRRPYMPTVADVEILAKTLGSILAGKPQSHGALTVFPVLAPMQAEPEWLTLAEAGDSVRITEVGEEGSVPDLKAANLGRPAPCCSWTTSNWWAPSRTASLTRPCWWRPRPR
jgi:hypothetical protein